jgi:hypothetical protein
MRRLALVALILACTTARVAERPLFEFHDNFWLNLHHYVRAVGRGMPAPGELTPEERAAWDDRLAGEVSVEQALDALVASWPS